MMKMQRLKINELENVAIANALQLEATRATSALHHFNYNMALSEVRGQRSRRRTNPLPCYSVSADKLLYDVTLTSDPVTLTFDL